MNESHREFVKCQAINRRFFLAVNWYPAKFCKLFSKRETVEEKLIGIVT